MKSPTVYIYTPQKYPLNLTRMRKTIFDYRMKIKGISNGPEEVLKTISKHAKIRRTRKLKKIPRSASIWIPDNEENFIKYADQVELKTRRVLLGPNVRQHNTVLGSIFHDLVMKKAVVPSESMKQILMEMDHKFQPEDIFVWPAGVDTSYWKSNNSYKQKLVLIYCKGKYSQDEVDDIITRLHRRGIKTEIFVYGSYKQKNFKKILSKVMFVVWLGHTETQGLAQFQAWSMNVPTLIANLDDETIKGERGTLVSPSPFISQMTGTVSRRRRIQDSEIDTFIQNLSNFRPREWIIENASTYKSFSDFMSVYEVKNVD